MRTSQRGGVGLALLIVSGTAGVLALWAGAAPVKAIPPAPDGESWYYASRAAATSNAGLDADLAIIGLPGASFGSPLVQPAGIAPDWMADVVAATSTQGPSCTVQVDCTSSACTASTCTNQQASQGCTSQGGCTGGGANNVCTQDPNCTNGSACTAHDTCTSGGGCTSSGSCTGTGAGNSNCTSGSACTAGNSGTGGAGCTGGTNCTGGSGGQNTGCTGGTDCTKNTTACTSGDACTGGANCTQGNACTQSTQCTNGTATCTSGSNCTSGGGQGATGCTGGTACTSSTSCTKGNVGQPNACTSKSSNTGCSSAAVCTAAAAMCKTKGTNCTMHNYDACFTNIRTTPTCDGEGCNTRWVNANCTIGPACFSQQVENCTSNSEDCSKEAGPKCATAGGPCVGSQGPLAAYFGDEGDIRSTTIRDRAFAEMSSSGVAGPEADPHNRPFSSPIPRGAWLSMIVVTAFLGGSRRRLVPSARR